MNETQKVFEQWQLVAKTLRERMYGAPTAQERERWHAMWLIVRGWTATQVGEALDRDAHTIGNWWEELRKKGPSALSFEQSGSPPRPRPGATSDIEGGGAGSPKCCRGGTGVMDLERGAAVRSGTFPGAAEQPHLPKLPAPTGFCREAAQETLMQDEC